MRNRSGPKAFRRDISSQVAAVGISCSINPIAGLAGIAASPAPARVEQLPEDPHGWVGQRCSHDIELAPVGLNGASTAQLVHDLQRYRLPSGPR